MGTATTSLHVLRYLSDHPGKVLWIQTMASDMGLSVKQVQNAMWRITKSGNHRIRIEAPGHAWTYFGPADPDVAVSTVVDTALARLNNSPPRAETSGNTWTLVGHTGDGDVILQDSQGNLWRVFPL